MDDWVTIAGYIASVLVAITFMMKTMIPLRRVAIMSNVAFIIYGFFGQLYPVLILHCFLLPLNIYRLIQMQNMIKKVKEATKGEYSFEWLVRYMTKESFKSGEVIFRKGEDADKMYFIQVGKVRFPEFDVEIQQGQVFGEMGIFSPYDQRTASAECVEETIVYSIGQDKLMELYYQNPDFGFFLVKLLISRFIDNTNKK